MEGSSVDPPRPVAVDKHLVILVHGIRDFARWQSEIRSSLEEHGFTVAPTNYGRMNLLEFLLPFPYFRNKAKAEVWLQILHAIILNPDAKKVSIIAHSFGTYLVAGILREQFILKLNRIIFCGSVVRYNFPWEQITDRFEHPILNDVGTADPWPATAESLTTGYGSTGTFGFNRAPVYDRFHNNQSHGFFLNRCFCRTFWVPFLRDGKIVDDDSRKIGPPLLQRMLSIFKIKYAIFLAMLVVVTALGLRVAFLPGLTVELAFRDRPTTWDGVQKVVDAAGEVCPLPFGMCKNVAIRDFLVERRYIRFSEVRPEVMDIVSCRRFEFKPKELGYPSHRDPVAVLEALGRSFSDCISFEQESNSNGYRLEALTNKMTPINRINRKTAYLCGCSSEQIHQFQNGAE